MLAEAPLLPVAAAFAVGILAAQWVPGWSLWALAAAAVLIAAGAMCLRWCRERIAAAVLLAAVATLGFVRASPDPLPPDHVSRLALPQQDGHEAPAHASATGSGTGGDTARNRL